MLRSIFIYIYNKTVVEYDRVASIIEETSSWTILAGLLPITSCVFFTVGGILIGCLWRDLYKAEARIEILQEITEADRDLRAMFTQIDESTQD